MFKSFARTTLSIALLAATLTGCGNLPQGMAGFGDASLSADAARVKLKYMLGARLTGRKVIDDRGRLKTLAALPGSADLRSQCSPIANQGQMGACTAFAIVKGLDEFLLEKSGNFQPLSPAFLYYEERKAQNNADMTSDTGSSIETGMQVLQTMGTCPEADDPYLDAADQKNPAKIKQFLGTAPGARAIQDALQFKIDGAKPFITPSGTKRIKPVSLSTMSSIRASLAGGMPVVAGIVVFQSMMSPQVAKTGMVPMPNTQAGDKPVGGHAIMLVGYDDAKQVFIVRNSWSSSWGDKGYFYLPYDYVRAGLVRDAWTATL